MVVQLELERASGRCPCRALLGGVCVFPLERAAVVTAVLVPASGFCPWWTSFDWGLGFNGCAERQDNGSSGKGWGCEFSFELRRLRGKKACFGGLFRSRTRASGFGDRGFSAAGGVCGLTPSGVGERQLEVELQAGYVSSQYQVERRLVRRRTFRLYVFFSSLPLGVRDWSYLPAIYVPLGLP